MTTDDYARFVQQFVFVSNPFVVAAVLFSHSMMYYKNLSSFMAIEGAEIKVRGRLKPNKKEKVWRRKKTAVKKDQLK